ncbi:LexA family protein [Halomonas huangheensis]|uniref:Peptidase S24/S26A/S26B/S26C domain-containing protein n=1 Tax=Halomonas huangheensis TaxID=1178482 RepID=W1N4M6_9GAMM|nr:S24 family peptidase [Halomonas huangheensis]ALM51426.1 repressor [Halomonas huangheensis]ERL49875.1 hypothetical protein BJB45_01780 [Halomonas huangheensis]
MTTVTLQFFQRLPNLPIAESWAAIDHDPDSSVEIPLAGSVSAGMPIEVCSSDATIHVPSRMIRRNTYALQVRGNSMIDCNIFDGDVIIIERQESAENGETAVVMINDQEVTLKKLYIEKNGVRLQPANTSMPAIYLRNSDIRVLGLVMGVARRAEMAA